MSKINGLRADLHDPDCPGMDADGNWLGYCDCIDAFLPYEPDGLRELVASITYKPGWSARLAVFSEGDDPPRCWALHIISDSVDSYDHDKPMRVDHEFLVPPASYRPDVWAAWLFDRFCDVERHEAGEFFMLGGVRTYAPHHGNGEDPYRVWHHGTAEQARKKAGQD